MIIFMHHNFKLPPRSFYGTNYLAINVINNSKKTTNILIESQSSAKLLLYYLINYPLAFKLQ